MAITLEIVSSILQHYKKGHGLRPMQVGHFPATVDEIAVRTAELLPYIEERGYVDKIHLHDSDFSGQHIIAQIQVLENVLTQPYQHATVANIYLAKNLNLCWRRFAVCKEMYHCMIDRLAGQRVTNLAQLKELLFLLATDTTSLTGESAALNSERLAELYALETLFPVEFRLKHLDAYQEGSITSLDLASMYRVPQNYVELALQPHYLGVTQSLRGKLLALD